MAQFGIIGKSLGHSFSPAFFKNLFREKNLVHTYNIYEIPKIEDVVKLIDQNPELKGFNVTIPYKSEIIPFLHSISPEADKVGAVNTVVIERNNGSTLLHGYNTDVFGFQKTIDNCITVFKKALILGTGGASKAVAFVLKQNNIAFSFVSRNPEPGQFSYDDLNNENSVIFDLIINTTPIGMHPYLDQMPEIPMKMFCNGVTVIDLIYNPEKTLLLKKAELNDCKIVNGSIMLKQQAIKAWEIWST